MKSSYSLVHNRSASTVDQKAVANVPIIDTDIFPAVSARSKYFKRRLAMTRQLVSLIQFVKEAKEQGEDLNNLFIDPDELISIDEDLEDDEE